MNTDYTIVSDVNLDELESRRTEGHTEVTVTGHIIRGDDGKLKFETDHVETVVHYAGAMDSGGSTG